MGLSLLIHESSHLFLPWAKLNLKIVKRCIKQLSTMVNNIAKPVIIIVVTIKSIHINLQIKREICANETRISHPLQRLREFERFTDIHRTQWGELGCFC